MYNTLSRLRAPGKLHPATLNLRNSSPHSKQQQMSYHTHTHTPTLPGKNTAIRYNYLKQEPPSPPPRTQLIYFLNKNPIAVRPIVSGIGGPTEKISSFLDYFLQPIVSKTPSYLKNT